ncbi:glutamate-rich WD repeat-containing protein 1 [Tanacetum coccineum]
MGYSQDRWSRWHNLRQQCGQSVQEYITEFRRLAVMLGISMTCEDVFTKYVAGLQRQTQNELRMYSFEDISSASRIAMAIEVKNKNGGLKIEEDVKEHIGEKDNKKKLLTQTFPVIMPTDADIHNNPISFHKLMTTDARTIIFAIINIAILPDQMFNPKHPKSDML